MSEPVDLKCTFRFEESAGPTEWDTTAYETPEWHWKQAEDGTWIWQLPGYGWIRPLWVGPRPPAPGGPPGAAGPKE